jgi:hypothetical protein
MNVYSAELLPLLFSELGRPEGLSLMPIAASGSRMDNYYEFLGPKRVRLFCPLVAAFSADEDRAAVAPKAAALQRICTRARGNIASRVSEEHIYEVDGGGLYKIVAGPGSAQHFRTNFTKRLGEVFYNLGWILDHDPTDESVLTEFRSFESLYLQLEVLYGPLPGYVSVPYSALKTKLMARFGGAQ